MRRFCMVFSVSVCEIWTWSPRAPAYQPGPITDFDGDGTIGFGDFLLFAAAFGRGQGDAGYDAKYELDEDGAVGFSDFVIFSRAFGNNTS